MKPLTKNTNIFLTRVALCWGLLGISQPLNAQSPANIASFISNVRSVQFEQLCFQHSIACADIGKAAHLTTDLIYQLFDTERTKNPLQRTNVINQIAQLYAAKDIKVVNKRLKLSDFFVVKKDRVFGGYAILIRQLERQQLGRRKLAYVIAFKGTYVGLEDPNDLAANVAGLPVNMYSNAAVLIHEGFKNYAGSVFADEKSKELVSEILRRQKQPNTDIEVLITGHSLGGTAILYAAMLADAGVLPANMKIMVFGAPAFTQQNFQQRYPALVSRITRVETEGDFLSYEKPGLMRPIYDTLSYIPLGKPIKATAPEEYRELMQEREIVLKQYQASSSPESRANYFNVMQKVIAAQSNIHVYSYRYFYEYYRRTQGANLNRNVNR
ncbi:lipase family protein [Chroococcidiopsis sp.]|uniref:lipase family protein n=1 Tax=Chroococcidiopsis sp. TaxID=3088168 RepID=UPI003F2CE935